MDPRVPFALSCKSSWMRSQKSTRTTVTCFLFRHRDLLVLATPCSVWLSITNVWKLIRHHMPTSKKNKTRLRGNVRVHMQRTGQIVLIPSKRPMNATLEFPTRLRAMDDQHAAMCLNVCGSPLDNLGITDGIS